MKLRKPREKKKNILKRLFNFFTDYGRVYWHDLNAVADALSTPEKRQKLPGRIWAFVRDFYHRIATDGIMKESAALTYITILGFIPFITLFITFIPDLPFLNIKEKVTELVGSNFLPESAQQINIYLDTLLRSRASFSLVSFLFIVITSYSLFNVIRVTFDRILSIEFQVTRDLVSQFISFLGTMIFGFLLILLLFSSSSLPLISLLSRLPLLNSWMMFILPFLIQFFALTFIYFIMPSIRVRRASVFRGAFWTSLVWIAAKAGFDWYITNLTNFKMLYGVLAAIPIFLLYIFINWVIILAGIVLVSVIDRQGNSRFLRKDPKRIVRITMEMYADENLSQRLEGFIMKGDLNQLTKTIEDKENE
ncbi:MAG: YihY/virulence factor BrkB family protein [Candidatus Cloacimonetes bacterium]|nr:YihY/virulence factor BrkB family protein [Candidatus Cloacimonadota bacterium]